MARYAEIIPYIRMPKSLGIFDYEIKTDQKVKIGSIVKIYFRNKKIIGLVVNVKPDTQTPKKNIKSISEVLELKPVSQKYIKLVIWFSSFYFISPALAFKSIFPKVVKQRNKKIDDDKKANKLKLSKADEKISQEILSSTKNFLLVTNQQNNKLYCDLIQKTISKGKQVILLYPEINLSNELKEYFLKFFAKDKFVIFHSKISDGKYFTNWQKVHSGEAKIIIGTRVAIFAPVKNLGLIIINSEHDSSYKQWDQNPRYHVVEVAEKLSEIQKAKLVLVSNTPSVEKYYQTRKNKYKMIISMSVESYFRKIKKSNYSFIGG